MMKTLDPPLYVVQWNRSVDNRQAESFETRVKN